MVVKVEEEKSFNFKESAIEKRDKAVGCLKRAKDKVFHKSKEFFDSSRIVMTIALFLFLITEILACLGNSGGFYSIQYITTNAQYYDVLSEPSVSYGSQKGNYKPITLATTAERLAGVWNYCVRVLETKTLTDNPQSNNCYDILECNNLNSGTEMLGDYEQRMYSFCGDLDEKNKYVNLLNDTISAVRRQNEGGIGASTTQGMKHNGSWSCSPIVYAADPASTSSTLCTFTGSTGRQVQTRLQATRALMVVTPVFGVVVCIVLVLKCLRKVAPEILIFVMAIYTAMVFSATLCAQTYYDMSYQNKAPLQQAADVQIATGIVWEPYIGLICPWVAFTLMLAIIPTVVVACNMEKPKKKDVPKPIHINTVSNTVTPSNNVTPAGSRSVSPARNSLTNSVTDHPHAASSHVTPSRHPTAHNTMRESESHTGTGLARLEHQDKANTGRRANSLHM